ncbi:MAG: hypothetical protein UW32_C0001G0111 [Candidatus Wolfebacteria bacterium GW2011_GWE2_44_13]|uniref:Uncharacterized protein n=1 Tax=Candidatus Wolfebacteria bacterium GW2011_GWE2_44_13 TaxID=1619017 RepID=A0A0G1K6N4_9BACT|nr:MAG: hypothetical protein UW32_C0001G0111 [Candidatus Wolfebacteria bacterium GW2011_GWE2_44_13]
MGIFRIKGAGKISEEARCLSTLILGVRVPSFCRFGGDPEIFSVRSFALGVASERSKRATCRAVGFDYSIPNPTEVLF